MIKHQFIRFRGHAFESIRLNSMCKRPFPVLPVRLSDTLVVFSGGFFLTLADVENEL